MTSKHLLLPPPPLPHGGHRLQRGGGELRSWRTMWAVSGALEGKRSLPVSVSLPEGD